MAIAGVVAAALIGWFAYAKLWPEINKTHDLAEQQQAALADLSRDVSQHKSDEDRLQLALNKAMPSIYLVCQRDAAGNLEQSATAWVFDQTKGILATNGHVAKELAEATAAKKSLIARSNDNPPRDFVIKSVLIHPGFDASMALMENAQPQQRLNVLQAMKINIPGNYCDVALMYVDKPDGLGPSLPLADDAALDAVTPGLLVGFAGYPMENVDLGGVNIAHPTPSVQVGHVIAMTDYFGAAISPIAARLLVQHSIPSAGGSSGSPVVNADGKVIAVHSAGNSITPPIAGAARIPTGAIINYAQRADLLRELADGRADAAQAKRSAYWKKDLDKYYQSESTFQKEATSARAQQIDPLFDAMLQSVLSNLRLNLMAATKLDDPQSQFEYTGTLDTTILDASRKPTGSFSNIQSFNVKGNGVLCVGAVAQTADSLDLYVSQMVDGKLQTIQADSARFDGAWFQIKNFVVHDGEQVVCEVEGTPTAGHDDEKKFTLRAYLIPAGPFFTADMPPDARTAGIAAQWVAGHMGWVDVGWQPKLLTQANGVIDSFPIGALSITNWSTPLKLSGAELAGEEYLVVASAMGNVKISLGVYPTKPGPALASDFGGQDPWAKCTFTAADNTDVNAIVTGPKGTLVSVRVYTAGPPATNPPPATTAAEIDLAIAAGGCAGEDQVASRC